MSSFIPYGRQDVTEADIDAVIGVLRSDWLTQGPIVPAFEQAIAERCGATHGVAANSATAALHLACLALGVRAGDTVWTSPITFVASANCARYCGAAVDFVDIDPATWTINVAALADQLARARASGAALPSVVIPVHHGGQSCDMAAIAALAHEYGFRIIEDAAHALGASYDGQPVGNCRYSDITVFSFHPVKLITTGEGGMAVTNDAALAARMARLRSHGITRDRAELSISTEGPWYYEQVELGFNYRLTDIQAALGASQLERLDDIVARRNALAARYDGLLGDLPYRRQHVPDYTRSARHLYMIRVPEAERRPLLERLRDNGIGATVHYFPVHQQPYYRDSGARRVLDEAEAYGREAITLPLYPALSEVEQDRVVGLVQPAWSTAHRLPGI